MNENPDNRSHRSIKRIFSLEEKINYCTAWEKSEMDMVAFCKANRISRSALYQWSKKFKKGNNGFILFYKRLETGRFHLNFNKETGAIEVQKDEFGWLLAGLEWQKMKSWRELNYDKFT